MPPRARPQPTVPNRAAFARHLDDLGPEQRIAARRGNFDRSQRARWALRYPDEVPLLNGELEWIALRLADLD